MYTCVCVLYVGVYMLYSLLYMYFFYVHLDINTLFTPFLDNKNNLNYVLGKKN